LRPKVNLSFAVTTCVAPHRGCAGVAQLIERAAYVVQSSTTIRILPPCCAAQVQGGRNRQFERDFAKVGNAPSGSATYLAACGEFTVWMTFLRAASKFRRDPFGDLS